VDFLYTLASKAIDQFNDMTSWVCSCYVFNAVTFFFQLLFVGFHAGPVEDEFLPVEIELPEK
jgi:hypothetical protein